MVVMARRAIGVIRRGATFSVMVQLSMQTYLVYFKYKPAEAKKPGPIRHYRIYANNIEEVRQIVARQGTYPDLDVLEIKLER